jgi:quaternary ammonium compound-resistance protein SugE
MAWLWLFLSGLLEVVWSGAMKASEGFTKPWPTALMAVSALVGLWLLSLAMRSLPLGVAYPVWVGIGAVGAFLLGVFAFGETASALRILSVGLIVAGIIGLRLSA